MTLDARGSPAPPYGAFRNARVIRSTKPFRRVSGAHARVVGFLPPASLLAIAYVTPAGARAKIPPRRSSASERRTPCIQLRPGTDIHDAAFIQHDDPTGCQLQAERRRNHQHSAHYRHNDRQAVLIFASVPASPPRWCHRESCLFRRAMAPG